MRKLWNAFLMLTAASYLVAFSIPAFNQHVSRNTQLTLDGIQWVSWIVFASDLLFSIYTSGERMPYIKHHPFEIATVVLPFLRPLRLLRVISFGSLVLQKVAIGKHLAITARVLLASVFLAYVSAVQVTIVERSVPGSNIKTVNDGIWWAITTVTTVGYGDRFPTTLTGRLLAVCLMLVGISLMGVITASVAAWFIRMSQDESA